jgi:hypothetical protein
MQVLQRLIAALWFGSAVFLMLAASAAFGAAPNATAAADIVGALLTRWHYIALGAPLALFALEFRNVRTWVLSVIFAGLMLAATQSFVDLRIRSIRMSLDQPVSSLPRDNPIRRSFGALHGISMLLLLSETIAAAIVVSAGTSRERERVAVDVHVVDRIPEGGERPADLGGVTDDHDE